MYVCIQGMNSDLQSKEVDPDMAILNAIVCMKLALTGPGCLSSESESRVLFPPLLSLLLNTDPPSRELSMRMESPRGSMELSSKVGESSDRGT